MSADPLAVIAQMATTATTRRANEAAANRAAMPICMAAVDAIRAIHGVENVKVRWLSEGGKTIGKQPTPDAGTWECSADTWLAMQGPEPVAKGWGRK